MQESIYCPVCNADIEARQIVYDFERGEQICSHCGVVMGCQKNGDFFTTDAFLDVYNSMNDTILIEDRTNYIMGHESKMFGSRGSGLSGVGSNIITSYSTMMDFSSLGIMSSIMDKHNVDYMGNKIKDSKAINRMRYINNITTTANNRNPNEKNAKQVIMLIKQISQKKNFPQHIQERAVGLYRDISDKNDIKRLQYKITAYWCLYYTLREHNLTPSLPEFLNWLVDLGFIDEPKKTSIQKKINKVQIFILELMNMKPILHSDYQSNLVFLCNKHYIAERIKREAMDLGNLISKYGGELAFQGRSPRTIATMLISVIMTKEGMRKDCSELLKELKVTTMILKKIINELSQIISEDNEETQKIKRLLRTL